MRLQRKFYEALIDLRDRNTRWSLHESQRDLHRRVWAVGHERMDSYFYEINQGIVEWDGNWNND